MAWTSSGSERNFLGNKTADITVAASHHLLINNQLIYAHPENKTPHDAAQEATDLLSLAAMDAQKRFLDDHPGWGGTSAQRQAREAQAKLEEVTEERDALQARLDAIARFGPLTCE